MPPAVLYAVAAAFIALQFVLAAALHRWAARVAVNQKTAAFQVLRWLPAAAAFIFAVGLAQSVFILRRAFAVSEETPMEEHAREVSNGIAEAVNCLALFWLPF